MSGHQARSFVAVLGLCALTAVVTPAAADGVEMSFVPNRGQAPAELEWLAHVPGATLGFAAERVSLSIPAAGRTVGLRFEGSPGPESFEGVGPLPGTASYFRGADPAAWRSGLPTFSALALHELYDGIDLRFEGSASALKGTFRVAPGADPERIRWSYDGVDAVSRASGGELALVVGSGRVTETAPVAWQLSDGARDPVAVSYRLGDDGVVGFELGEYDLGRELVIDPYLEFATLVGGGEGDEGRDVTVDGSGYIYVTGSTRSADFPAAGDPQSGYGGPTSPSNLGDAFVFKLTPDGETVMFMTYLGGSGEEVGDAIALAPDGGIVIAGSTESTDFPTVNPIQAAQGGQDCSSAPCTDLFIAKLAASGSQLVFSTYLGGSRDESAGLVDFGTRLNAVGVDVDTGGAIYVVGSSDSPDFPTVSAFQNARAGLADLVLVKLSGGGGQLLYSTYLGGSGADYSGDVAVGANGRAWIVGGTLSSNFPTRNAFDADKNPLTDAIVAQIDTTRSGQGSLLSSTYLGGDEREQAFGVDVDGAGNVYVAGWTGSTDLPLRNAFQGANASAGEPQPRDGFLSVLSADGATLMYGTYFGGSARDLLYDLAVGEGRTAVVTGSTLSDDLPTRAAYQSQRREGSDLFVARFDPTRSGPASLVSSTYLGGNDSETAYGVAASGDGAAVVTGLTGGVVSDTFPVDTTIGPNATSDGVLVARLAAGTRSWMLVGSRANGANNSIWRTDLGVFNPGGAAAAVEIRFHGSGGVVSDTLVVAAGDQVIVQDVVGSLGVSGSGAVEVVSDREVVVTSRTFNVIAAGQQCSPGGTLGQGFGAMSSGDALRAGDRAWLPQLAETSAYRSNIALTNTGAAPASVSVRLYDGTGRQVGSYVVDLAPGEWKQENRPFARIAGQSDLESGYAEIVVQEGAGVLAAGSVVDNITNDPTTVPMVAGIGNGFTTTWVLVGSHVAGANNSLWRTDLAILNRTSDDAEVTVRVHSSGGVVSTTVTVPSRDQVVLTDVLGMVGVTGSGAIEMVSDEPVMVSSRIYNRVAAGQACFPNGTLGQENIGYGAGAGLSAGRSGWLTQLTENDAYRTNIALTNTGDTPATVTVRLYDGNGTELGSYTVNLAPGQWKQENRPFERRAGQTDLAAGYARVTVDAGSGVLVTASVVDNVTNDPTTIVWIE